jgi:peptide/nickel transport system substrate-binding protein
MARRSAIALALGLTIVAAGISTEAPAADKTFVYALEGRPDSLDSAKAANVRTDRVTWLLCEALINTSRDGQSLEPGLAESWTVSEDGRVVTVRLRAGVLFHDGTPLDAAAVKTSFERQLQPKHEFYAPRNMSMLSGLIDDIQIQDSLTLAFKLKHPALHYLSDVDIVSPTALSRLRKDFERSPVCTGPFKFESWSADRIVLVANDKYWAGRPRLDRVVFRIITDGKAIVEGLISGEVDFAPVIAEAALLERLREHAGITLVAIPGLNINYLGLYTERPPFNDPLVRRAVAQAINVPRLTLFLGRGMAAPAKGPLPPAMRGHDPAVAQLPHDPTAAAAALKKAGAGALRSVRLIYNGSATLMSEIAGAIQSDLRRVGIAVELEGKQTFGEVVAAARARQGDMFVYNWYVRGPYPDRLLAPLFHSRSTGTSNLTHYSNPAVDRLLEEASRLPDGPEQRRMFSQIQKAIVDDAPMVFLYHFTRVAAHARRVQNLSLKLDVAPHDKLLKVDLAE